MAKEATATKATDKMLQAADSAQSMGWEVIESGSIDPRDLIIDESKNGRRYISDSSVGEMVVTLLQDGQKSPICVRQSKDHKDKLEVVFGFRRAKAGVEIHNLGLKKGFTLRYELVDVDDMTAFLANLQENHHREGLTDIDDAHNMAKLRDEFNLSQTEIAKHTGRSNSAVSLTLKLLKLSAQQQKLVALHHTSGGKKGIPVSSAYELADIEDPKERQKAIDDLLKQNDGKVPRSSVRKRKSAKSGDKEQRSALTAKEIRFPFDTIVDEAKSRIAEEGGELSTFESLCSDFSKFCRGRLGERAMLSHLRDALPKK